MLQSDIFRARLKEAFGTEPQETTARKLNMSQANISRILTGTQQPVLDTIYLIAKEYNVSVDWLLGLSDDKHIPRYEEFSTYASVVETIHSLYVQREAAVDADERYKKFIITIKDPLLKFLLRKCNIIYKADDAELFRSWKETRLSLFKDMPVLPATAWSFDDPDLKRTESEWLEAYEDAKKTLQDSENSTKNNGSGG